MWTCPKCERSGSPDRRCKCGYLASDGSMVQVSDYGHKQAIADCLWITGIGTDYSVDVSDRLAAYITTLEAENERLVAWKLAHLDDARRRIDAEAALTHEQRKSEWLAEVAGVAITLYLGADRDNPNAWADHAAGIKWCDSMRYSQQGTGITEQVAAAADEAVKA